MRKSLMPLLLLLSVAPSCVQAEETPKEQPRYPLIGEVAPDLGEDVRWLQGEPVPEFQAGRVYVVDLWATWCAACYGDMTHLSELASRYADRGLTVVGVAVEHSPAAVSPDDYVARRGERMQYPVAWEVEKGRVFPKYVNPQYASMPFLIIIDRQGRLAWTSDPAAPKAGFDEAVEQIVAGTYDLEAAAAESRRQAEAQHQAAPWLEELEQLRQEGKLDEARNVADRLVALDPRLFGRRGVDAFTDLLRNGRLDDGYAYGRQLVEGPLHDNPDGLINLGRTIVDLRNLERRDYELAIQAGERANQLMGENDPDFLTTLADIYFSAGDPRRAVALQRKAVEIAEEIGWNEGFLSWLRDRLSRYGAAPAEKVPGAW